MKKYSVQVELNGFFTTRVVVSADNAEDAQFEAIKVTRVSEGKSIAFSPEKKDYYAVCRGADIVDDAVVLTPVFRKDTDNVQRAARTDVMALAHKRSVGDEQEHFADQSTLAQMMCDMRHWCKLHNISFDEAVSESKMHFEAEQPFVENVA